jgi:hypothetical protein
MTGEDVKALIVAARSEAEMDESEGGFSHGLLTRMADALERLASDVEDIEPDIRHAWEAGFRLCRAYGDNHAHFDGEQKERHWQQYLHERSVLRKPHALPTGAATGEQA